jgi:hypothetical protein
MSEISHRVESRSAAGTVHTARANKVGVAVVLLVQRDWEQAGECTSKTFVATFLLSLNFRCEPKQKPHIRSFVRWRVRLWRKHQTWMQLSVLTQIGAS